MTTVSQLLLGVASQPFMLWGFVHYSYWHVLRINTRTTSFSLSSSSFLSLSKGTVFVELFSSQTSPSNFVVWPVGLQGSAGCEVEKKGNSGKVTGEIQTHWNPLDLESCRWQEVFEFWELAQDYTATLIFQSHSQLGGDIL